MFIKELKNKTETATGKRSFQSSYCIAAVANARRKNLQAATTTHSACSVCYHQQHVLTSKMVVKGQPCMTGDGVFELYRKMCLNFTEMLATDNIVSQLLSPETKAQWQTWTDHLDNSWAQFTVCPQALLPSLSHWPEYQGLFPANWLLLPVSYDYFGLATDSLHLSSCFAGLSPPESYFMFHWLNR